MIFLLINNSFQYKFYKLYLISASFTKKIFSLISIRIFSFKDFSICIFFQSYS